MGHWATVCRASNPTTAALQGEESEGSLASVLCALSPNTEAKQTVYEKVLIGGVHQALALIDPGATDCYIMFKLARKFELPITDVESSTKLANGDKLNVLGFIDTQITIKAESYCCRLHVVESLIADLIIGMDVVASHQSVYLDLGGPKPPITFHLGGRDTEITPPISLERDHCTKACCSMFPIMTTEPPALFPDKLLTVKPISSKSRRVSADNALFMKTEVKRLLDLGIIELSVSPWRAQAFVVKGPSKKRMVIDNSETVNLYTDVDAYPFPDVESMLTRAAAFHYFSKIDMKSAYHQIPLRSDDKPFTAFEVGGRLYQFTRLRFGVTNAVPAFQRIMDSFIERNQLRCAEPYLDDVYIGGITKEEHDRNLHAFLKAAEKESLTLNMDKCTFGTRKLSLLGHIIENGSKKPDSERLRVLMEYTVPHTAAQLKRLLGFFAYYAKWVPQYSLKVKPLLEAQKQGAFPLNRNCVDSIDSLKQGIASASLAIPIAGAGPLVLETDASGTALGATLSQGGRPLAFYSRTLSTSEQMQSSVEREAMAIVEAFRKWGGFVHILQTPVKN